MCDDTVPGENADNQFVSAVIVTYQPNVEAVRALLAEVIDQISRLIIVDNGSDVDFQNIEYEFANVKIVKLKSNFGIAYAQNIGIEYALHDGVTTHILLLDQDSIPDRDMVYRLLSAFALSSDDMRPIGAVGPTRYDPRVQRNSFFMLDRPGKPTRSSNVPELDESRTIGVASLIASGTLIPITVLKDVGLMKSDYFIEHVDTEWSYRARNKGYRLLGVKDAILNHNLGDKIDRVWFFGYRGVTLHSPLRNYYMFRNTFALFRDVDMSLIWRFYLLSRVFKVGAYSLLFGAGRGERLNLIALGIYHGLTGRLGKLDEVTHSTKAVSDLQ